MALFEEKEKKKRGQFSGDWFHISEQTDFPANYLSHGSIQ